jgi:hypothetical protein
MAGNATVDLTPCSPLRPRSAPVLSSSLAPALFVAVLSSACTLVAVFDQVFACAPATAGAVSLKRA